MATYDEEPTSQNERKLLEPKGSKSVDMTFTPSELDELALFLDEGRKSERALSRDNIGALVRRAIGNQMFISEAQQNGDVFFVKTRGPFGGTAYRRVNFL